MMGKHTQELELPFAIVCAERDRLKAINAELLEALKLVIRDDDFCHKTTLKPMPKEMRDFLDAAIARAESGT